MEENKKKFLFLKKGEGKLASSFHGETKYSLQRQQEIIDEQKMGERMGNEYAYNKKYGF